MSNAYTNNKLKRINQESFYGFGATETKVVGTIYQASTDGLLTVWGSGSSVVYSDASASPSTVVSQVAVSSGAPGYIVPILKDKYWQVVGATEVRWTPLNRSV